MAPDLTINIFIYFETDRDRCNSCYNVQTLVGIRRKKYSYSQRTLLNWPFLSFTEAHITAGWSSKDPQAEGCCYLPLYQRVSNRLFPALMGPGIVALGDLLAQLSMACLALGTSTQDDQELGVLQ